MSEKKETKDQSASLKAIKEKNFTIDDLISKEMKEKIEKEYGRIFFPMLVMLLPDQDKFVFFFHEMAESVEKKEVEISFNDKFSDEEIKKFLTVIRRKRSKK